MATKRTELEQNIEQIAGIIASHDSLMTAEEMRHINETTGWTFNVNYDSHDYIDPMNEWTRVEGCTLSGQNLDLAWDMAQAWLYGESR